MIEIAIAAPNDQYQPFWIWPAVLGAIGAIAFLLWLLNRLFPSTKKYYHAGGNALMRVDAMLLPDRKHIIEASECDDVEEDVTGEPPESGSSG